MNQISYVKNLNKKPQLNKPLYNNASPNAPIPQNKKTDNFKLSERLSLVIKLICSLDYRQYNQEEEKKILQNLLKTGYLEIVKDRIIIDRYY